MEERGGWWGRNLRVRKPEQELGWKDWEGGNGGGVRVRQHNTRRRLMAGVGFFEEEGAL